MKNTIQANKITWPELLKLIPVIYAFLVALTYLKEIVYFSLWSIQIADYLSLSEILTSSLDDLLIFFVILFFFTFFGFPLVVFNLYETHYKEKEIKWTTIKSRRIIQIVYIVFFNIILIYLVQSLEFYYKELHLYIYIPSLSLILFFIYLPVINYKKVPIKRTILSFIIALIFSTIYFAYVSAHSRKERKIKNDNIIAIEYDKKQIKSGGGKYFIRMTKNYIFYFDSKNTIAYPIEKVGFIKNRTTK